MANIEYERGPSELDTNISQALANLTIQLEKPEETILREHQHSMVQAIYDFLKSGESAGYLSEPTGVGKSVVIAYLANILGLKTVILSPTQQILTQTSQTAKQFFPDLLISNYYTDEKDLTGQVINTTYQSIRGLAKNPDINLDLNDVQLVICDEAHMGLGEKRHTIYRNFPNAIFLGATATSYFTSLEGFQERGLVDEKERWTGMFKNCIHEMTIEEAIEREILANLDVLMIRSNAVIADIKIQSSGEYRQQDLEKFFATESRDILILGMLKGTEDLPANTQMSDTQKDILNKIHERIRGKKTAIFAVSINHADQIVEKLKEKGISAAAVHSQIDPKERSAILNAYQQGKINVVVGVDMLRIGWDSPETEVGIYARPTASGIVKTQELGRILRRTPNKNTAIAIELVDTIPDKRNAQVLIPNIFDPEFVLRGTATGQEPNQSKSKDAKRETPQVTFSGMDIDSIIEEAMSQEMLKNRFKRATIEEISTWFESSIAKIIQENPAIGTYQLFQTLVEEMPQRIPSEIQQIALQAIASLDSNINTLGKKILPFLLSRQLLSAVDHCALTEDIEEKNDLLQEAISTTIEMASRIRRNNAASLISGIRTKLITYTALKYDIPRPLIATSAFKVVVTTIEGVLGDGTRRLSADEINSLALELSQEADVPEADIKDYLMYKIHRESTTTADITSEAAEKRILAEEVEIMVASLTQRERKILMQRFGLSYEKEKTLDEIAAELDVGRERVRQIEAKALRKARHPSRSRKFIDYKDPHREPVRNPQSLFNGAITAFYQNDYTRAETNLAEAENIVCESLSEMEKEIIRSLRNYPYSYNWGSKIINEFINFSIAGRDVYNEYLLHIKGNIFEAVEKLQEVWRLKSKLSH